MTVANEVVRLDAHSVAQCYITLEDRVDVDEHIFTTGQLATNVDPRRICEADAFGHKFADEPCL